MATKKAKPAKTAAYTVKLLIWGKTYEGSGATLPEALASLKVLNPKGKSILVVKRGDQVKERVLSPVATARLFSHGLTREVALKHTSLLFGL